MLKEYITLRQSERARKDSVRSGGSQLIKFIILKYKWHLLVAQLLWLSWSLSRSVLPYIFGNLIDQVIAYQGPSHQSWSALRDPILIFFGFWFAVEVAFRLSGIIFAKFLPQLEGTLRAHVLSYVYDHSASFFHNNHLGSIARKVSNIAEGIRRVIAMVIGSLVPSLMAIVFSIIIFANIKPEFAYVLGSWAILHLCLYAKFSQKAGTLSKVHAELKSQLMGFISDSLAHHHLIRAFNGKSSEIQSIRRLQKEEEIAEENQLIASEKVRILLAALAFLLACLGINGYAFYSWSQGHISAGDLVTIFTVSWNIIIVVWLLGVSIPDFFKEIGTISSALSILDDPHDIVEDADAPHLIVKEGKIEFKNVSFSYEEDKKKKLFTELNLTIRSHSHVGLVGISGSGKTSLTNLLQRIYNLDCGSILIDGQDISKVTLASLKKAISVVSQETSLLHRSVFENIAYGKPTATLEEVIEAAKLANAHDYISALPQGYHTIVGENGAKFSSGEKQRIAIARAFLKDSPIIILDEPTSNLDSLSEKHIQNSLDQLLKGKTAIIIAHRLATLKKCDNIFVFKNGQVVEEGQHDILITKGEMYQTLWHSHEPL